MTRTLVRAARKPVRLVHLGLGAFFRAHQARLTQLAEDGAEWGYAAFTVRSPEQAEVLRSQDELYTLIERTRDGDAVAVVDQLSAVHDGADLAALRRYLSDPAVAAVTLTITEAGYGAADAVPADLESEVALVGRALSGEAVAPSSPLARLVVALDARRAAGAGAIAVVPCDNLPGNGAVARRAIAAFASAHAELAEWIDAHVSFVSTAVDRITPRLGAEDRALAAASAGFADASPVVTEPYTEWVLSGTFPAGRPRWETAGAVFAHDVEPYERRKLRMLNGAHTLLAIAGLRRGLATVDEAIADPQLAAFVDEWWREAAETLPTGLADEGYRQSLRERFANPSLRHALAQIAENTVVKLESRIVPVVRERQRRGQESPIGLRILDESLRAIDGGVIAVSPSERDGIDRIRDLLSRSAEGAGLSGSTA